MDIKVGRKVWYVPAYRHASAEERAITKVGRRWAYLDNNSEIRFDKETHRVDGGDYCDDGMVYASKQAHDDLVADTEAWMILLYELRRSEHRSRTRPPTAAVTQQIRELLGMWLRP